MRKGIGLALFTLLLAGMSALVYADDKPKYTIKEVMKNVMAKGKLKDKFVDGKATDAEKKELVEYLTALGQNKPPKGDDASWKEKTGALLAAAKDGSADKLKDAANCAGCHNAHKGK
jgi:Na+-translocating ferredoxin:NAD+ oxidoreductase RnfG subunit